MVSLKFPLDLGSASSASKYPFIHIQIVKFQERTLVTDAIVSSSRTWSRNSTEFTTQETGTGLKEDLDDYSNNSNPIERSVEKYENELAGREDGTFLPNYTNVTVEGDVFLPLPQNLTNDYQLTWEMSDQKLLNTITDSLDATSADEGFKNMLQGTAAAMAGMMIQRVSPYTANPKKQALFHAIEPRTFSLNWTFSPQSYEEAKELDKIIKVLTIAALPSLRNKTDAVMGFPSEFMLTYYNTESLPKVHYCVCNSISGNMTPNTLQLLKSGHPVQVALAMSFTETSIRSKQEPGI